MLELVIDDLPNLMMEVRKEGKTTKNGITTRMESRW